MEPIILLPDAYTADLWQIHLPDWESDISTLKKLLDPIEIKRMERFKFKHLRQRFLIAHALLRKVLSAYIQIPAEDLCFDQHDSGKPFLPDFDNIQFNISHTDDDLIIAITEDIDVGIDIEKIKPDMNFKIAKRFFTKVEYNLLQQSPDSKKNLAFFRLWTGKEAIVKMTGLGIANTLQTFSIDPNKPQQTFSITDSETAYLKFIDMPNLYVVALATREPIKNIRFGKWKNKTPTISTIPVASASSLG